MNKLATLLLLAVPVTVLAQEQKQPSTATVCFYRPHRFEGSALKPPVYVDDIDVAHIHNGDAVQVTLSPGAHKVYSNDKSTGIELDAKAGQTYYVRVDIKAGAWKGHGQITLIDPQEGKFEFSKQKLSVTRDLTTDKAAPAAEPTKASSPASSPASPTSSSNQNSAASTASSTEAPAPVQSAPVESTTPQVQSTDQGTSLGDIARQNREKKAKAQTQAQATPPQN